jgi:hypothetical protein
MEAKDIHKEMLPISLWISFAEMLFGYCSLVLLLTAVWILQFCSSAERCLDIAVLSFCGPLFGYCSLVLLRTAVWLLQFCSSTDLCLDIAVLFFC